jgi:hypothetical protein
VRSGRGATSASGFFGDGQTVAFQNMSFGDGQMVNFQNMSGEPVFSKAHARRTSKICVLSQKAHF